MADEISKLKRQRGQVKASLTRTKRYFDELVGKDRIETKTITELKFRLNKFEPLYDSFQSIQGELEIMLADDPNFDQSIEEDERKSFESNYYELLTNMQTFVAQFESKQNIQTDSHQQQDVSGFSSFVNQSLNQSIKLPTITLPKFNGDFKSWVEFRDSFNALVNANTSLSDIQRFYYLKSSLGEKASQIIENLQVSSENYAIAWGLLSDRFEQKALIIHSHLSAIFEYPTMHKESHSDLRNLYDNITKNLRSLKTLGQPTNHWDSLIIYIITSKLDLKTRKEWELYEKTADIPSMDDINKFLKQRCEVLEKLSVTNNSENKKEKSNIPKNKLHSYVTNNSSEKTPQCYNCKGPHTIFKCESFLSNDPQERISIVKKNKLCYNCLSPWHSLQECSHSKCIKCGLRHNSLLHINKFKTNYSANNQNNNTNNNTQLTQSQSNNSTIHNDDNQCESNQSISVIHSLSLVSDKENSSISKQLSSTTQVLLSTAIVKIKDSQGNYHKCRALLDSGSMSNFITSNFCKILQLPEKGVNFSIVGVGQSATKVNSYAEVNFCSTHNAYASTVQCLVLPRITENLPIFSFNKGDLNIPTNLKLADPQFNQTAAIDLLLGSTIFWQLLCSGQVKVPGTNLNLQKTQLGWIIAGSTGEINKQTKTVNCHSIVSDNQIDLDKGITRFWNIEELNNKVPKSQLEEHCENHFLQNVKRDQTGKFVVKIPLKESVAKLCRSKELAKNRFYVQERKLIKNPKLQQDYVKFMAEYEKMGHMTEIVHDDDAGYYMPHHAVIRESRLTTKIRIVYDASMKTETGFSLNDVQHIGATVQSDLFSIILRFRKHAYVMTADISKMYRMVLIQPEQRQFQKIFWRDNPSERLKIFQLNTVTYGTASAPWLATRCLLQLALEHEKTNQRAADVIKTCFYVDDFLCGCNSKQELIQLQHDVKNILESAGFMLRKWLSNETSLQDQFRVQNNVELGILSLGDNDTNKTLGVQWNANRDTIQFSVANLSNYEKITKRAILSVISQIYDPLGLLGPIIIVAKIIMQQLWEAKLQWDESVPQNIFTAWNQFCNELPMLNNVELPRQVLIRDFCYAELHVFADASQRGYGTCLYIRSLNKQNDVACRLLTAKSRVAPIKQVSLPRLELCAALLAAQLSQRVCESMQFEFNNIYYWSDSMIVLCWLKSPPNRWKTFVANRVSEIQHLTDIAQWHHVRSKLNPADLISRGISVSELVNNKLWFTGPEWLHKPHFNEIIANSDKQLNISNIEIPEQRTMTHFNYVNDLTSIFNRFSSAQKIKRVMAYVLRFISNCTKKQQRTTGYLSSFELDKSLRVLIKLAQQESFPLDYEQLEKGGTLKKRSKLINLNGFMDDEGLIRVGGRIQHSNHPYDKKHPLIVSSQHKFTKLLMEEDHKRLLHCGPTMLLAAFREQFWPIHGRSLSRDIVHKCIKCFKTNPKPSPNYLMGNLPECRLNQYVPFCNTGCDFGGPFLLRDKITRDSRGTKLVKAYVCLFICLTTRAVHLEAVSSLSAESFMATLKRFIGRRGKPIHIYTDNALNFVSTNSELRTLYEFLAVKNDHISGNLATEGITWHFIPPRSPNFGGSWEAGIKSAKFHLKRVLGTAHLNFEDFSTILVQIEAILNSRPLCPLPSTPDQLNPLTPAHFLLGKPLTALPDYNYIEVPENRLKRYQRLQAIIQHFWKRWSSEYLSELQTRNKWQIDDSIKIKVGTVVLVRDENSAPMQWPMGIITELHPGKDNIVRVVSVKVKTNVLKRAITKLCLFPFEVDNNN